MKNNDKMILPKLRFKEFDNSQEWKKELIGDFLTESRIKGNNGNEAKKLTVKLWGKGVYEKDDSIKGSENTQYFIRKSGQFIYSKLDFLNQAFGIIPIELDGYESTVDLPCFDVKEGLDTKFLLEYVQRPEFYKKNGEIADGGRKAKRIQVETFLSFPLYKPFNKEEQQKIADCLTSLDDLINAENKKLELLKEHKKGLMQKLFPVEGETMPQWRFPEFRDSEEWEVKRIGECCKSFSGGTPITSNKKYYNGKIPFIRSGEINQDLTELYISQEGLDNSSAKIVKKGDVLVALYGANSGDVALSKIDGAINQAILCLRHETNNSFVYQYLSYKKNWIIATYIQGGQGNLSGDIIKSLEFRFPKQPKEQQIIVDCLSYVDILIEEQTKKIEQLKEHKRGLMQGLFPSLEEVE
jgi:type I restriction enzyme S subunit